MKYIVITWGFSTHDGKPYLDCYLEIDKDTNVSAIKMMELRGVTQGTKLAMFHASDEITRETLEEYVARGTEDVFAKLREAHFKAGDVIRKKPESNAVDFIVGFF